MIDTVTIVKAIDWQGLYYNGVLQIEGHSLSMEKVLNIVKDCPPFELEIVSVDSDWLDDIGYLPRDLEKVKFDERS